MTNQLPYLKSLNEQQILATKTTEGPILILAGVGTGKTTVLTSKIAYIIDNNLAKEHQIIAVSFTNSAANKIKELIQSFTHESINLPWCGTFHFISSKILRKHSHLVGLNSNFTVLNTKEQQGIIKQVLEEPQIKLEKDISKHILSYIDEIKNRYYIDEIKNYSLIKQIKSKNIQYLCTTLGASKLSTIYELYSQKLLDNNAVDFGDLIIHVINILKKDGTIQNYYHNKFKYILVDEYQDTNQSQYLWLKLLTNQNNNICCAGDDDQSINSWRGANNNILRFEQNFPNSQIFKLEQNYRSVGNIIEAASELISNNNPKYKKNLYSQIDIGSKININGYYNDIQEAQAIAEKIIILQSTDIKNYSDLAILVRTTYQAKLLERELKALSVPCKIKGKIGFFEQSVISDAIAYLRIIHNQEDDLALKRIINTPKRGIGKVTIDNIEQFQTPMFQTIQQLTEKSYFNTNINKKLSNFVNLVKTWKQDVKNHSLPELCKKVLEESLYIQSIMQNIQNEKDDIRDQTKLKSIIELYNILNKYSTLEEFLENINLTNDNNSTQDQDFISIMTLHASKGLEFDTVFLPGWEENILPHYNSLEEKQGLEEERRLAYVGITRAKKNLFISYADHRLWYNQYQSNKPSRFILELPPKNIVSNSHSKLIQNNYNSQNISSSTITNHEFKIGQIVTHKKFGDGKITNVTGDKLNIIFNQFGKKTILYNFVTLR